MNSNGQNPFYEIMPQWFLLIGIVIATLAAIIASQALISGSFTLINEAISLNFWPRVSLKKQGRKLGQRCEGRAVGQKRHRCAALNGLLVSFHPFRIPSTCPRT